MRYSILLLLFLFPIYLFSQNNSGIPHHELSNWFGVWEGHLRISDGYNPEDTVMMQLTIDSLPGSDSLLYELIYRSGQDEDIRSYRLIKDTTLSGQGING
jgi:hypothetical protein